VAISRPSSASLLLLGHSRAITSIRQEIGRAARTQAKVLILGETGVGKEVVARLVHEQSAVGKRAFVAINCSGIPETLLESELFGHARGSFTGAVRDHIGLVRQADGGTLFLDELGEMSLRMQAVLLRFTETGEVQPVGAERPAGRVNTRVITATNRDLRAQIATGAFREDLYYRLNVIQIDVPPLRDRGEDVLLLLDHYLTHAATVHGLRVPRVNPDAAQLLLAYDWPGNVRELRNVTERLVVRDQEVITPDDLPAEIRGGRCAPKLPPRLREDGDEMRGPSDAVQQLWDRLQAGEDFWTVVHQRFMAREVTREDLAALIDRGLQASHGSYRRLLGLFHLSSADYKRFHAFLYQQKCNLPVAPYRMARTRRMSQSNVERRVAGAEAPRASRSVSR